MIFIERVILVLVLIHNAVNCGEYFIRVVHKLDNIGDKPNIGIRNFTT